MRLRFNVDSLFMPNGGTDSGIFRIVCFRVLQMPIKNRFSLTDKEMAQISSLDLGYVGESVKHFNPEFVRGCLAVKIHD